MRQRTRLAALLTAAIMVVSMLPAFAAEEDDPGFLDVPQGSWYYDAVYFAEGKGLMGGYDDESFGPADTLQRSMLAQVFYNWEQQPYGGENEEKPWAGVAPFADVKAGVWYENAVNWARSEKIMQGSGASFDPERALNHQELAVALYGFAGYKNLDKGADADVSKYADGGEVAGWAKEAMAWALTRDMFHVENNKLNPTAPVQRCELAYALMQMHRNVGEVDQVRLMAGAFMHEGSRMEFQDCAVMVQYHLHTTDWPEEGELSIDELLERAKAIAKDNGYVPLEEAGKGSKLYAMGEPWADGVSLVVLGEEGTFRPGVLAAEEGMTRRFAKTNIVWGFEDDRNWRVYEVEEQDYYTENGEDHPCFLITLLPAF